MHVPRRLLTVTLFVVGAACSERAASPPAEASVADAGDGGGGPPAPEIPITLSFRGRVGRVPFRCGETYSDVGLARSAAAAQDLRFFVSAIRFSRGDSAPVAMALAPRERWQGSGVGLVDLEDGSGECTSGTAATNDSLIGTLPAGTYDTLSFEVGVPDSHNHLSVETAGPPFAASKLQWDWTNGFIHFAAQLGSTATTEGDGGAPARVPSFFAHLGSSACTAGAGGAPTCARKNRPTVRISAFDPARDAIVVDVAKVFERSNLDENTPGTIAGCMSGPNDPECGPVFERFGLDHASGAPSREHVQQVFSAELR